MCVTRVYQGMFIETLENTEFASDFKCIHCSYGHYTINQSSKSYSNIDNKLFFFNSKSKKKKKEKKRSVDACFPTHDLQYSVSICL